MEFVPSFKCESCQEKIDTTFEIRQKNINYILNIRTNDDYLILKITEEDMLLAYFEKNLTISDIQNMHKTFIIFSLFQKFVDYIKSQIDNNKLEILKINNESILLRLKQENVEIILKKKKIDNETIIINILKELKQCKSNQKNIEQKYEKILSDNKKINQEIEKLNSLNNELKKENEEIKVNINQLKAENKILKQSNKDLEVKIEKYKKIDEQNKLNLIENPVNEPKNSTVQKIKKLNLDGINNNIDNIFNRNDNIKFSNLKTKPTLRRIKSFSNRLYTFNDLSGKHLDVIKEDAEKDEQNKYKEINKRNEFKEINEENYFNSREDNDINSLNININKIPNLNNNNKKLLRNTLSYRELPIKQIFNKRLTRNNNVLNSWKNNIDNFAHKTFTNWRIGDINNNFGNLLNTGKLNDKKEIKIKENYNNDKFIDLKQNFISNKINSHHKNICLNDQNKNNNKKIQIENYDSNYRTITESEQPNSNKIFNKIYNDKNNSNENKIENSHYINNKKVIIGYRNDLKLKLNNNLNSYANLIKNVKDFHIINSVLQCLTNVEQLVKYFLSNKEEIKTNNIQQPFSNAFLEMIENLWENKLIKEYAPTNILNIILNQKNKSFFNSKEFIIFILDKLHKELNKNKDKIPAFTNSPDDNFDSHFQKFEKYFKKKYNSIIADIFYRKLDSQITCFDCNNISHCILYGKILEFSLEEVNKYININKKNITINDCLKYYQRQDFVSNKKCDKCNQTQIMGNIKILLTCPKVMIICLKAKKDNENKFIIEDIINLNDFFYYKDKQYNYELISIMTDLENDNFIAFCKSFVDKKWYKYFDSKIVPSSFKEISINGIPNLLIYSLIENKN